MKIIWLTPECPYPPNTGGRVAMWKRIEYLSKTNDIYLYSIIDNVEENKYKNEMLQYCKQVNLYLRKKSILNIIKSIFVPYPVISRKNKCLQKDVEKDCADFASDCIIVDFPQMMVNLNKRLRKTQKIVLHQHNIEFQTLCELAKSTKNVLKKVVFNIVGVQMRLYERKLYNSRCVSLYTFLSISDKKFFETEYEYKNTYLVPIGMELCGDGQMLDSHNILFVGKMSYFPNIEAVNWFAYNVFPKVLDVVPDAKFYIVGKEPIPKVCELAKKNNSIVVTGGVESVQPYYEKCNLVVVPVFHGGGVNVKILEALGYGKIVITTDKGVDGTELEGDRNILVANTIEKFSEYCITALLYPEKYETIMSEAKNIVLEKYSWKAIVADFNNKLRELAGK